MTNQKNECFLKKKFSGTFSVLRKMLLASAEEEKKARTRIEVLLLRIGIFATVRRGRGLLTIVLIRPTSHYWANAKMDTKRQIQAIMGEIA